MYTTHGGTSDSVASGNTELRDGATRSCAFGGGFEATFGDSLRSSLTGYASARRGDLRRRGRADKSSTRMVTIRVELKASSSS